jgi:hypothetical protein
VGSLHATVRALLQHRSVVVDSLAAAAAGTGEV